MYFYSNKYTPMVSSNDECIGHVNSNTNSSNNSFTNYRIKGDNKNCHEVQAQVELNVCANVISETSEAARGTQVRHSCQGAAGKVENVHSRHVSNQVCAHKVDQVQSNEFVINDNGIDDYMCVTMGAINHSANCEVISTDVLIMLGEGQNSGNGAQAQFNYYWVTSLGNWGHPGRIEIANHAVMNLIFKTVMVLVMQVLGGLI
jgi:hypothetical protein